MRRCIITAILWTLVSSAAVQAQPRDTSALMSTMREYLAAMDRLTPQAACAEVDLMISSVLDSALRNDVAVAAYRHFRTSKAMSSDNVAIDIYDRWFANFRAVYPTLEELDAAEFHAFVNRASLLGKQAAELTFLTEKGDSLTVPRKGKKAALIFFYSPDCPKCLYISHRLRDILNNSKYKLDVYLVYTGEDMARWDEYRHSNLNIANTCKTRVWHLFGGDTPYQLPYSVTQTPRLFLIDKFRKISGRMLDDKALLQLLETRC